MLKRSTKLATIVVASLSLGLTALAMPALDTVITQGYDEDAQALIIGAPANGSDSADEDCAFEGTITYGPTTTTTSDSSATSDPSSDGDADEVRDPALTEVDVLKMTADTEYEGFTGFTEDGDCPTYSLDVTGPNGQINHGTFQSAWVHALKELNLKGMGCLVSSFSKVGYGDAEKLTTAEAQEAAQALAEVAAAADSAPADVEMSLLECAKGKDKAPELSSSSEKPAKGPAWKTDSEETHPSELKGKNKDK